MKRNPVFHLTAITHRKDALFQTVTIGGKRLGRTDTAQLGAVKTEAAVWSVLHRRCASRSRCCCTPSSGGMYNVRVSMRQRVPGEARNAIAAVFGSHRPTSSRCSWSTTTSTCSPTSRCDWALATRFQADRDFVVASGFRVRAARSVARGSRTGAKIGFDCTMPFGKGDSVEFTVPLPPELPQRERALGRGGAGRRARPPISI